MCSSDLTKVDKCLNPLESGQLFESEEVRTAAQLRQLSQSPRIGAVIRMDVFQWALGVHKFLSQSPRIGAVIRIGQLPVFGKGDCGKSQSPRIGAVIRINKQRVRPPFGDDSSQSPRIGAVIRMETGKSKSTRRRAVSIPSNRGSYSNTNLAELLQHPGLIVSIPSNRGSYSNADG